MQITSLWWIFIMYSQPSLVRIFFIWLDAVTNMTNHVRVYKYLYKILRSINYIFSCELLCNQSSWRVCVIRNLFCGNSWFLVVYAAIARTVGHLSKSAEVMKLCNNLMKAPEMAVTMQEFSKEMTKVYLQTPFTGVEEYHFQSCHPSLVVREDSCIGIYE